MRHIIFRLLIVALAVAMLPTAATAYMNNIEFDLSSGSGSYKTPGGIDADFTLGGWGLSYTRYFNDIGTAETPYGTRAFLEHPAMLGLSLSGLGMRIEDNNSASEIKTGNVSVMLGGMYYIDNGDHDTGIGLTLVSRGEAVESSGATWGTKSLEKPGSSLIISLDQYVNDHVSIGLDLEGGSFKSEDNLTGTTEDGSMSRTTLSASALISEKYWIDAALGGGKNDNDVSEDEDVSTFNLTGKYYLDLRTGLFLTLQSESTETDSGREDKLGIVQFGADHYFSESMRLTGAIGSFSLKQTISGTENFEAKATALRLGLGFFF